MTFLEKIQIVIRMTQDTKEVVVTDKEMDYTAIVLMGIGFVERH